MLKWIKEDLEYIITELGEDNAAFDGQTILLCGSQGFLGLLFQEYFHYLNEEVLGKPCSLICFDNSFTNNYQRDNNFYRAVNIVNPINIDYVEKPTFALNCAGIASPKEYFLHKKMAFKVSTHGTENFLDYVLANKVKSCLNFSSSEVYGNPEPQFVPTNEQYCGRVDLSSDRLFYDLGKMAVEAWVNLYNQEHNINAKIIRPFNVFGPTRNDGRVIPNFVNQVIKGEKIKIFGDGGQNRSFCWFSDFIIGAIKVLLCGDTTPYNIGNPNNQATMLELAQKIEKLSGRTGVIELVPKPQVYTKEPERRQPDIYKAQMQLNFEPKVSLDVGLEKFYRWAKDNYV